MGVVECKPLTLRTVLTIVSIISATVLGTATVVYTSYSRGQDMQNNSIKENSDHYIGLSMDVTQIQTDLGYIKDGIRESKEQQKKIIEKLDELRER